MKNFPTDQHLSGLLLFIIQPPSQLAAIPTQYR